MMRLAQGIYAERTFDLLPILADALEDAGCADTGILKHCRQPGDHARGCWVVDLFTGRGSVDVDWCLERRNPKSHSLAVLSSPAEASFCRPG
ncbi:MAG: hypothetical protein K2R98_13955 [Gemmataceae bacterium]|nr:hypothetical protein [Gemmataceae bacterium]